MPFPCGNPTLSARFLTDPDAAVEECRQAILNAGGSVAGGARELEVSTRTLYRWIDAHPSILDGIPRP
jgi:hypothetical protein